MKTPTGSAGPAPSSRTLTHVYQAASLPTMPSPCIYTPKYCFELRGLSSTGRSFGFAPYFLATTHFRERGTLYMLVGLLDGWACEVCLGDG